MSGRTREIRLLSGFRFFCLLSQVIAVMCLIEGYLLLGALGVIGLTWAAVWDWRQDQPTRSRARPTGPLGAGDRAPRRPRTPVGSLSAQLRIPKDDALGAA